MKGIWNLLYITEKIFIKNKIFILNYEKERYRYGCAVDICNNNNVSSSSYCN
jgi:hypothetical protein